MTRKIQIFNWHVLHGIVPCMCTLANKDIGTVVNCPVYNVDPKDLKHMLFECRRAAELWRELINLRDKINKTLEANMAGSSVLKELLCLDNTETHEGKETILVSCWYIWWMSQQIKNNESLPSPRRAAISIRDIVTNNVKIKGTHSIPKHNVWKLY